MKAGNAQKRKQEAEVTSHGERGGYQNLCNPEKKKN